MHSKLIKLAGASVLTLSLLGAAGLAQASSLTTTQVSAIVGLLQSFGADSTTIANVTASLNGQPTSGAISTCLDIQNDLYVGKDDSTTNGEVSKLQRLLISTGDYPGARVTGYYGSLTAQAVVRWQKGHGMDFVTKTSGVGKMTRAKLSCSNMTVAAPIISSITPASGPIGTTVSISGTGLTGFEGDIIFTFEKSDGSKVRLGGTTGSKVTLVVKEPCRQGETYYPAGDASGIPRQCTYVALTPGTYQVYLGGNGGKLSNAVTFIITP